MTKLPRLTGRQIVDALGRGGFEVARIRGSHHFLRHVDGRRTVVPLHAGDDRARSFRPDPAGLRADARRVSVPPLISRLPPRFHIPPPSPRATRCSPPPPRRTAG
ncbi:MAG TPA: type II toxin-antitoxin system HicA family toxin [Thermoanaerobaculia bacterium]|nr:type II toxin-antitoxin system HicA family toxin [Thermoanaerobaculia bacterium]